VPIQIKFIDRASYYQAFQDFDITGKTEKIEQIMGLALTNSYHKRPAYVQGQDIVSLQEYGKNTINHTQIF